MFDDITAVEVFPLTRPTIHHKLPSCTIGVTLSVDTLWRDLKLPRGYDSDGASIPQIFWSISGGPWHPRHSKASLIHDWLYLTRLVPKQEADEIFMELLIEAGKKEWLSYGFYAALQTPFGQKSYNRAEEDLWYLNYLIDIVKGRGQDPEEFKLYTALQC